MSIARQDIVDAVVSRLQGILTTGGYSTNLGTSIHKFRATVFGQEELPALNLRDMEEVVESLDEAEQMAQLSLTFQAEIAVSNGRTSDNDMRTLIADVWMALGVDPTFSGKVKSTYRIGDSMVLDQEADAIAGALLEFRCVYHDFQFITDVIPN
jgi:hypothetical protein